MRNICLIGLPTSGKSKIGRLLYRYLNKGFIDTDEIIKLKYRSSLKDLINIHGNKQFLDIESKVTQNLIHNNVVLATGGSVIYNERNIDHIKDILHADIFHLKLSEKEFIQRMDDPIERGVVIDTGQSLKDIYKERIYYYDTFADYIIPADKTIDLDKFKR